MAIILSKTCKPDNFESHKSLKLSFMNIEAFVRILLIESFLESKSPDSDISRREGFFSFNPKGF